MAYRRIYGSSPWMVTIAIVVALGLLATGFYTMGHYRQSRVVASNSPSIELFGPSGEVFTKLKAIAAAADRQPIVVEVLAHEAYLCDLPIKEISFPYHTKCLVRATSLPADEAIQILHAIGACLADSPDGKKWNSRLDDIKIGRDNLCKSGPRVLGTIGGNFEFIARCGFDESKIDIQITIGNP